MNAETDEQFLDSMEQWVIGSLVFKREHRERLFALARRGAEAVKMMAEQDCKYNQNTNDLIAQHAGKVKEAAARIAQLEGALREISLMDKVHEHDLFSATCVARAALTAQEKQ
jgi:hypothetical protein